MPSKKPEEITPEVTPEPTTATQPVKPEERTFNQAEVNELVSKNKASAVRSARKKWEQENPTVKPVDPKTTDSGISREEFEAEVTARKLSDAMSRVPGAAELNADQRLALEAMFDPLDPGALVGKKAALFGDEQKPPTEPEVPEAQPGPGHIYDPGAPSAPPREASNDPRLWDKAQIARLRADGTFLEKVEAWKNTLPGGGAREIFSRRKVPK